MQLPQFYAGPGYDPGAVSAGINAAQSGANLRASLTANAGAQIGSAFSGSFERAKGRRHEADLQGKALDARQRQIQGAEAARQQAEQQQAMLEMAALGELRRLASSKEGKDLIYSEFKASPIALEFGELLDIPGADGMSELDKAILGMRTDLTPVTDPTDTDGTKVDRSKLDAFKKTHAKEHTLRYMNAEFYQSEAMRQMLETFGPQAVQGALGKIFPHDVDDILEAEQYMRGTMLKDVMGQMRRTNFTNVQVTEDPYKALVAGDVARNSQEALTGTERLTSEALSRRGYDVDALPPQLQLMLNTGQLEGQVDGGRYTSVRFQGTELPELAEFLNQSGAALGAGAADRATPGLAETPSELKGGARPVPGARAQGLPPTGADMQRLHELEAGGASARPPSALFNGIYGPKR